jgi:[acyl-carrier-protein] S-malonyltransferase
LQVSAPFHCALMKPAEERLAPELRALTVAKPRVPVVANVDATPKCDAQSSIDALIQQIASPVRWEEVMRRLVAEGATTFVEVGPGTVLTGLARKQAREATCVNIDSPDHLPAVEALFRS